MDKVTDSDSVDAGSIPARSAMMEERYMENESYSTFSYTKLFLLMIIPIYGLCFTVLLAFNKDVDYELKCLARGALIARVVFLIFATLAFVSVLVFFLPMLNDFFAKLLNNQSIVNLLR